MPGATLVDSNVLLDVFTGDEVWAAWSESALAAAADDGRLVVNPVVYAEVSPRFPRVEELDMALADVDVERRPIPYSAAFMAGRAFVRYRRRGGTRRSPLPDFFIGAHAAVEGLALLTRDPRRYSDYFPTVALVAPGD